MSARVRFPGAAFAASAMLIFSGCGGGSQHVAPPTPQSTIQPYTGPAQLSNFTWGAGVMSHAQYVAAANAGSMSVDVQLQAQNLPGLLQYAKMASDPASALYRHFLTPQEIGSRFGASQDAYNAAAGYFQKYHLAVGSWPQHLTMIVTGSRSDMEAAFGTKFGTYRAYGRTFIGPAQQPHFSQPVPVSGVLGLVHLDLKRNYLIRPGNGNILGMSGAQLRRAFDFTGASAAGYTGAGISIGIIGTGPVSSADVPAIGRFSNVSVAKVAVVPAVAQSPSPANNSTGTGAYDDATGLAPPPPVTAPCVPPQGSQPLGDGLTSTTCNPEDGEAQLDTEQAAQLAPGSNVFFYLAYNTKDCATAGLPCTGVIGLPIADDEIQQAIADNTADALSLSYGLDEPSAESIGYFGATGNGIGPAEFAALASEGIAVFVSSGDNGAHQCIDQNTGGPTSQFCASYPASDPSVVSVGGVNYPMDSAGNLPSGAQITAWANNTTLGGDGYGDNSPGSGGAISQFFAAPAFQNGLTAPNASLGGKRAEPDVAMLADPLTGPALIMNAAYPSQSGVGPSGGTSAAAPEMAAMWAVVLQACKASSTCDVATGAHPWRMGNPNALLYAVYGKPAPYASTFYDVLAGSNGDLSVLPTPSGSYMPGYDAGKGYDLVTGLGVPFAGHLINAVVSGQNVP